MAESSERPGLFRRLLGGGPESEKVRTARFPLQAYGKLPIYKDFISIGLTDPAAREFRHWIDRGFSYRWAESEEYRETEIPAHGFLLRLPESKSCVAGSLWGSSDEGGLRRFPFAVFLSFSASQPAADPFAALHYLAAFERRCEEIRNGYAAGASLSAFYKAYRGSEFECATPTREQVGRDLKSALGDLTLSDFGESLFSERAAARWPAFAAELERAAARADDGPGAIRLPLGGVLPRAREVGFWLRWLERLDPKRRRPVTGILYSSGRGPGRAALFFRDLAPEDFLLLHPAQPGHARVVEVGAPEERAPAPPAAVPIAEGEAAKPVPVAPTPAPAETPSPVSAAQTISPALPAAGVEDTPVAEPKVEPPELLEAAAIEEGRAAEAKDEAVSGDALPFPDAQVAETPAPASARETFSALVVLVADTRAQPSAQAPPVVEEPPAAPALPEPSPAAAQGPDPVPVSDAEPPLLAAPPEQPTALAPAPPGWDERLSALIEL